MKIKSAKSFRLWYKTKVKKIDKLDKNYNENFVGTYHDNTKGFFEMYHGDKPDIARYLPSILKIAEDGQAIYEFLQNAVDCNSTHFYIFYNEKYFLAINNGDPFDVEGLQSILNIAQTTKKDADKIGRFGIGFKLAHRLVGKNEGTTELVEEYKGPVLFSWSKLDDLNGLIRKEKIEETDDENAPYLVKLLLTNFPTAPNEAIKDIGYQDRVLFPESELYEMIDFLNESFQQHSNSLSLDDLKHGSMFFIKLGEGKKELLDKDYNELENGIQYSMNTLKKLQKVYINSKDIEKIPLELDSGIVKQGTDVFEHISPEYKDFDIKFAIGYNKIQFGDAKSYEQIEALKKQPNFYKYFPMGDEVNKFGFIVHCDSFSNEANRRKLQQDKVNENLFPEIATFIVTTLDKYKETNRDQFLNLYACLLLSDIPGRANNEWLRPIFYDKLLTYLKTTIPTKIGFVENAQNVKIKKLNIDINLSELGLEHIQWFEWNDSADKLLIDEARNTEKLGIERWNICNIIEKAKLDSINSWITTQDEKHYDEFLNEIEKNGSVEKNNRLSELKLFKFSDGNFYSAKEATINYNRIFNMRNTIEINEILIKLGFITSIFDVSTRFEKIYSSICEDLPKEKLLYDAIAEKCKTNILTSAEKKKLFLNFTNESTSFTNVGKETLKELCLFADKNGTIKPLKDLISSRSNTPTWLNPYKIKEEEDFTDLSPYLIQEDELFQKIILPKIEIFRNELSEAEEIKQLINFFGEKKRPFFNENIIQKQSNSFVIIPKSNKCHQITSSDEKARTFIEKYCSDKLIVLPDEFLDYKEEDGVKKENDLHTLILDCVNVDERKEELVDIVKYSAKLHFLQQLSEIRLSSETNYTRESYEYKVLDLACSEGNDIPSFRGKIRIETQEGQINLTDIHSADKITISGYELKLSKILPNSYKHSHTISRILDHFVGLGIQANKLNSLFGIGTAPPTISVYQQLVLQNDQQLAFLALFLQSNRFSFDVSRYPMTTDEQKKCLFDCMFTTEIENIKCKWSEVGKNVIPSIFGDFNTLVYPKEYACECEKLPEYLTEWVMDDTQKIQFLSDLGVWTEKSAIVELRKFWNGKNESFDTLKLAQESRFNNIHNKINLKQSLLWLKEQNIELDKDKHYESLTQVVRTYNANFSELYVITITHQYDYETLTNNSKEWEDEEYGKWKDAINSKFSIFLFKGVLPQFIKISNLPNCENYIFCRFNEGNRAWNENCIFINEEADIKSELYLLSQEQKSPFTLEDLWQLESSKEKQLLEKIEMLEKQLQEAVLVRTVSGGGISKEEQIDANCEAKQIVKERLEQEGFKFTHGIEGYSTVGEVIKEGIKYPLVVKSYKYRDAPLKIGANEWIQLMKRNSMFWVHFGNKELGCLKLADLLRKQDKLSISFSTENLDYDKRLENFAELLRYFKDVHFDFNSIRPDNYSTAENLNDYRFDQRSTETDLSSNNEELLHP